MTQTHPLSGFDTGSPPAQEVTFDPKEDEIDEEAKQAERASVRGAEAVGVDQERLDQAQQTLVQVLRVLAAAGHAVQVVVQPVLVAQEQNAEGLGVLLGAALLIPLLAGAVGLAVFVSFLVGHAFCMLVPAAKGNGGFARGLSVAAFCSFASVTGAWVGTILHYFYLWSVCHALKKPMMARNVSNFMYAHVILIVGLFVGFLLGIVIGTMGLTVVAGFWIVGLMLLMGVGSLALFIWYIVLLVQIRAAIEPLI